VLRRSKDIREGGRHNWESWVARESAGKGREVIVIGTPHERGRRLNRRPNQRRRNAVALSEKDPRVLSLGLSEGRDD